MGFVCLNSVDSLPTSKPPRVGKQTKLIAIDTFAAGFDAPVWLPIVKGEILLSDGIKVVKKDYRGMSSCNN